MTAAPRPGPVSSPIMLDGSAGGAVCVVGAGYVGLVTAVCLADNGRDVRLVEVEPTRLGMLQQGRSPIHEPGLDRLLAGVVDQGRLRVTGDMAAALRGAGVVLIAVGTPPTEDGGADLAQVRTALDAAIRHAEPGTVLAIKSTIPPGTTASLNRTLVRERLPLVMCPEFLREGSALSDFNRPARVVIGGDDAEAVERVAALFGHLDAPIIRTDPTSAEMIKYGTNSFLALKISFINEISHLCELTGADVDAVADGMGLDPRVGRAFLGAGLGFGGSWFPKDVRALDHTASYHGQTMWMLKAAIEVNAQQRRRFVAKVRDSLGGNLQDCRIAVLGLSFKPGTDDMRQAPAVDIIRHLEDLGASVSATDPVAIPKAAPLLGATRLVEDAYECVRDADAVVLVTEWPEFAALDWVRVAASVRRRVVVDGRNVLDGHALAAMGFAYRSVGRRAILPD